MSAGPGLSVALQLAGRRCVVVGDGPDADERVARLARTGAEVVRVDRTAFTPAHAAGAVIVMNMDPDADVDAILAAAHDAGALAYNHDDPERSDFAMPAIARRGVVTLAVSTDGVAPALARRLREELQRALDAVGPQLDRLISAMEAARLAREPGEARKKALRQIAERLRLTGVLEVVSEPSDVDS